MPHIHAPGNVIGGRYKIINFIDEGGMQEVCRANDASFDRMVALKVPKNPSARKRFNRSATMSARVTHPNVAKTLDFYPDAEAGYLIEELVDGRDLQRRLDDEYDCLDPHLAAHVMHHVVKAAATLHHAGVVHRDLKPSNIIVSNDPSFSEVKVTDFGIAKMAEAEIDNAIEQGADSISASSTVVGALPYMAPEVIQSSRNAGPQSDVWSIGAILFHVLTGKRPFGSGLTAIPNILSRSLPSKASVIKAKPQFRDLVDALWAMIDECLQLDPQKRPTSLDLMNRFGDICYSTAARCVGQVYNFRVAKFNWGFISSANAPGAFFHADSFYGDQPENGMIVNYAAFDGDPSPRAFPVLPLRKKS